MIHCRGHADHVARPNGLGISGGAPIDRYDCHDASDFQKSADLVGAKRRPLHARVGRHIALHFRIECDSAS